MPLHSKTRSAPELQDIFYRTNMIVDAVFERDKYNFATKQIRCQNQGSEKVETLSLMQLFFRYSELNIDFAELLADRVFSRFDFVEAAREYKNLASKGLIKSRGYVDFFDKLVKRFNSYCEPLPDSVLKDFDALAAFFDDEKSKQK